jgi:hypothetical protein
LGGVAAQEIVKKFGKYTPLNQWLYIDYFELLKDSVPLDALNPPQDSRYFHQVIYRNSSIVATNISTLDFHIWKSFSRRPCKSNLVFGRMWSIRLRIFEGICTDGISNWKRNHSYYRYG